MKPNLKKILLALMLGIGVMGAVSVQAQGIYEGRTWNQFYGEYNYFKGTPSEICAASIQSWYGEGYETQYPPSYRWVREGIYHGNYELRPSPPYTGPYIFCEASLKTTYTYPSIPELDSVHLIEDFGATIDITKTECPEGTVNEGGVCVPKIECPSFENRPVVRNPETGEIIEYYGYVACNGEQRHACAWLNPNLSESPEAQDIARDCALVHEQYHIDNEQCFGGECNKDNYVDPLKDENGNADKYFHADEVTANYADLACLAEGYEDGCFKKCTTSECIESCQEAIITAAKNTVAIKNSHIDGYCQKAGILRGDCREEKVDFTCRDGVSQPKLPEIPR